MIRAYTKFDYAKLVSWWRAWGWEPIRPEYLSDLGLIADETVAGFLYTTNSAFGWVEFLISDKDASPQKRSQAVDVLVDTLCALAKEKGCKAVFTSTDKPSLEKRLKNLDFSVSDRNVTQLCRLLGD